MVQDLTRTREQESWMPRTPHPEQSRTTSTQLSAMRAFKADTCVLNAPRSKSRNVAIMGSPTNASKAESRPNPSVTTLSKVKSSLVSSPNAEGGAVDAAASTCKTECRTRRKEHKPAMRS